MKKIVVSVLLLTTLIADPCSNLTAIAQENQPSRTLFIGGGALPEDMYAEFLKLTGPEAKLIVIPTASGEINEDRIYKSWETRGFKDVTILHTLDREVAATLKFSEPLKTATAIWFNGGSQSRIADAYLGTLVEEEVYNLLERGGIIGGSSAGAAIMSRVMISGGRTEPEITTGFELFPNALLDQHFLKRNRLTRLIAAVRRHPELIGYGIDEGTALVVSNNEYKVVGQSYVMRIELVNGAIKIDAYEDGELIPQRED